MIQVENKNKNNIVISQHTIYVAVYVSEHTFWPIIVSIEINSVYKANYNIVSTDFPVYFLEMHMYTHRSNTRVLLDLYTGVRSLLIVSFVTTVLK